MTVSGVDAWLTSAVDEKAVQKAIVLAGSLRRVSTAKKLAVFAGADVSETLREKLKAVFDLVVVLERRSPNGLSLEDYAKVEGFSLSIFNKCVYLSPNTLVLKNCDEIFDKYEDFAACENEDGVNSTVFLFTPTMEKWKALKKILQYVGSSDEGGSTPCNYKSSGFAKYFSLWIQNNFQNYEKLDEQYNGHLNLKSGNSKSLSENLSIVNFVDVHPLDLVAEDAYENLKQLGFIEKFTVNLWTQIFMEDVPSKPFLNQGLSPYKTEPIAIVGMSFRLPGGNNVDEFWDLLVNGKEGIRTLPEFRWTPEHSHFLCKDRSVEAGFLSVPVDQFDAKFFGISGKEAEFLDPQQRLLHEVAWEALEDAMMDPLTLSGTQTGVFVGSWLQDYRDMVSPTTDVDFFRVYIGNSIGAGAARLSHFLETTGPSIGTESGCSSAMVAVDMACKSLRNHDCSVALACGVNLILHPFRGDTFNYFTAADGRCKTFDAGANGFGRAEGCGVLIMKRLSNALRDGDTIWGLIRGSAVTQEGISKSLGTPTVHCESLAMKLALQDGHVNPLDVSFVEAHGTGTPVGDPLEIAAITEAYSKGRSEPLVIGSVKTNVGHTESASAIVGIIKVLLSMKHEAIPKHLNFKELNPAINLDAIPAKLPLETVPWPKSNDQPRIAGVSSFGVTGTDGHVIIQEPPDISSLQIYANDERPLHIMVVSAKSQKSFHELLTKYENILLSTDESKHAFSDLAYSANTGRATFNHRAVIVANNFKDAAKIIQEKSFKHADVQSCGAQLCFLFTGQGSQYPNMAATLYDTSPVFKDEFNKCEQILTKRYGINLRQVIWGHSSEAADINGTLYSQTSIFCVEYCLLKLWESWGVKPDYVMGHSLGEFAAAVAAGALDFEDALMLVAERSRLIDDLPKGKMLVIQADKQKVNKCIANLKEFDENFRVDFAALNSPAQTVVAGDCSMIDELAKHCERMSMKTIVLAATHAFHSFHMEPMLEAYHAVAQKVKPPKIKKDGPKYISGMEGKLISLESIDADYWVRHTRQPVNFMDACKVAHSAGCSIFLELGPRPVLSALTMVNIDRSPITCLPSIRRKENEWVTMLGSLAKLYLSEWKGQVNWKGFDRYYKRSRVPLPFYPFNRKSVWKELESDLPTVHPLLGKLVPTDCDHTIFESRLSLKTVSFTMDHVIGNTIVFPAAGFLEICLAGGQATLQATPTSGELKTPKRQFALKSLRIVSPLAFHDSKICRLQTTTKLETEDNDEIRYSIRITRHVPSNSGGKGEWLSHATAKYVPAPETLKKQNSTLVDLPVVQQAWEKFDTAEFYDKLPEVGLRFGPKFRSLETGWRSEKGMLFTVKVPDEDHDNFLIHPIIADAMIQTTILWTNKDKLKLKLHLPVQIEEFKWLQTSTSASRFIYCVTADGGKTHCILLDEQSNNLASMTGVDFIETTVKMVDKMILQQGDVMPKLWKEVWKSAPGALQSAFDMQGVGPLSQLQFDDQQRQLIAGANDIGEDETLFSDNLRNLARLFFLNAMYELGWKPKIGVPFTSEELVGLLPKPKEHFKKFIRFFLSSIADTGIIVADPDIENKYHFSGSPPTQNEIDNDLQKVTTPEDSSRMEYQFSVELGRALPQVLLGKIEALQLLFTDDPKKPNVNKFYTGIKKWILPVVHLLSEKLYKTYKECYDTQMRRKVGPSPPVLKVLEVGAGTGMFAELFLDDINNWGLPVEFYFTDVSASFFNAAEKKLEKHLKSVIFKKFDMEVDPLAQGFCPDYFDMIVAGEVIHVAKDIRETLRRLRRLLKPGGIFQIMETTVPDLRFTQTFGLLEGYWQFEDVDLRPNHVTLSAEKWEGVLKEIGCDKVISTPAYNNVHSCILAQLSSLDKNSVILSRPLEKPQYSWLIFCHDSSAPLSDLLKDRLEGVNRRIHIARRPPKCTESEMKEMMKTQFRLATEEVESLEGVIYLWGLPDGIDNRDQSQTSLPLLSLVQEMTECKVVPRLFVITQGTTPADGSQVTNPTAATLHGIVKSLFNENSSLFLSCLDLSPDESLVNQVGEIFHDLWRTDRPYRSIAYRDGNRLCCKLVSGRVNHNEPLPLPSGCARFQLLLPDTRVISDVEFGVLENYSLGENDVEVIVKSMSLNFHDVFSVIKPSSQFEDHNNVGFDFAGVVSKVGSKVVKRKVGDRVIGVNADKNLSLPSHIKVAESLVVNFPSYITFLEAVSLPTVFFTAFHCLVELAQMRRGDTVLIHTASGGVGLCAIQLAKGIGANIIATAGSKRKQNYLRSLGIKHVFHSRSTHFGKHILEVTNDRGVDIVLNSLTGEGFKEASLAALAKNGRFIEMSKMNVWRPEEVKELRPDAFYQIVDLTLFDYPTLEKIFVKLEEFLQTGSILPIVYERFDAVNIRGALNYLLKAKHVGKIICVMPEITVENSQITFSTPLFNDISTYLVTGGLGGIGFAVVKWMLSNGAKHIAIANRSPPKPEVARQLEAWNKGGKHVEAFAIDIGQYDQCQQLFHELKSQDRGFPKLRGVMHAAGVLADASIEDQTWSSFIKCYNPKVDGSWNLHDLTKDLLLEHFVVFSSMAATIGTPGQCNHSASNSFEDSLVAYRRSVGLPGTTINWGNWGEVGVATELELPGCRPISTSQGLLTLGTFLRTQTSHLSVLDIDSFQLAMKIFPGLRYTVDDQRLSGEHMATEIINSDEFWKKMDTAEDWEEKLAVFKHFIKNVLRHTLKIDQDEVIDDLTEFHTLGADSLMLLEIKNGLQNILGSRMTLNSSHLKDSGNAEALAERLLKTLLGEEDTPSGNIPTAEELRKLVKEDCILPEHVCINESLLKPTGDLSGLSTVLLTGVTGTLGPYLLSELSHRSQIKKIYCLIRKSQQGPPMERLLKRLHIVGLTDLVDLVKVECIAGDITEDKFGLSEKAYDRLSDDVDIIFNSAVRADHTAKYYKAPETKKLDVRNVNVKGTVRILEFAVHIKLKHVYHASTLAAVVTTNDEGCIYEDWQDVEAFDELSFNTGYLLSKHISEQLCRQAVERGVPCKTFRYPLVGGDSKTGRCDYILNHAILRWLAYLKLKCMPDIPLPLLVIPVDQCAEMSLEIFFNPKAPHDVYNISHQSAGMEQILIGIGAEFGIVIEPVSFSEFVERLKQDDDNSPLALFKDMYEDEAETMANLEGSSPALKTIQKYVENSSTFFRSRKLPQLIHNYEELESTEVVMRRDLQFLEASGVFDKFGIK